MSSTMRQKKAVDALVKNGGIVSHAMVEAGYSPNTAHTPQKLTESDGFKELMKENGLTPELVIRALADDIKDKPKQRLGELNLGADILGLKKKNDGPAVAVQVNLNKDKSEYE